MLFPTQQGTPYMKSGLSSEEQRHLFQEAVPDVSEIAVSQPWAG